MIAPKLKSFSHLAILYPPSVHPAAHWSRPLILADISFVWKASIKSENQRYCCLEGEHHARWLPLVSPESPRRARLPAAAPTATAAAVRKV